MNKYTVITTLLLLVYATANATALEGPALAVTDFYDMTDEKADLGPKVAENISTVLAASGYYRTIERTQIESLLEEKKLHYSDLVDPETASDFGKFVGARYVMVGSITQLGNTYAINARIVDVDTADVIAAGQARGDSIDDFDDMVDSLVYDFTKGKMLSDEGLITSNVIFESDFKNTDIGPFAPLGTERYQLDTKTGVLRLGDGKGKGEELRSGIIAEVDSPYFKVAMTLRVKRKGDFALYGRTNDAMATVFRVAAGEYASMISFNDDFFESDPDFAEMNREFEKYLDTSGRTDILHPNYGNLLAVDLVGAMFLEDAYYHGIPKGSMMASMEKAYGDVREKVWLNVEATFLADEAIYKIGKNELVLPTTNAKSGELALAVFDDCIIEITNLKITGL
ncbi:MAG: hypothetical protein GY771_08555 [bacterium]|nr:hypothetical protein [bacterium]